MLQNVAFWQGLMFAMLICVVWVSEIMDLSHFYYGRPRSDIDFFGAGIITAGICLIGFVTVANTYLQQRRILQGLIVVCSYCDKVKLEETEWEGIEKYLAAKTLAKFSHGICPECYETVQARHGEDLGEPDAALSAASIDPLVAAPAPVADTVLSPS